MIVVMNYAKFAVFMLAVFGSQSTSGASIKLNAALAVCETKLATSTFFVGERISLADVMLACAFVPLFEKVWVHCSPPLLHVCACLCFPPVLVVGLLRCFLFRKAGCLLDCVCTASFS